MPGRSAGRPWPPEADAPLAPEIKVKHRSEPVVAVENLVHRYGDHLAVDQVSLSIGSGTTAGLIGPDGGGKSTLLGLIAGSKRIQQGVVRVFGESMDDRRHRDAVSSRVAYMPQGLGKNLYANLSVLENLQFFGRLFALPRPDRRQRIDRLLAATGLAEFPDRLVSQLSGGMKQKLGLCCALIHDPDLLLLDEPTTGVDPLSRRQFWALIDEIRRQRPHMSVLVSTAYMDEAERFEQLFAIKGGQLLGSGGPDELKRQTGTDSLEQTFVELLPDSERGSYRQLEIPPRPSTSDGPIIIAENLTRRFGDFTAVERVSFEIGRGEIFGFLGSNGCGKTTTMKMLTGLLPASDGYAEVLGKPVDASSIRLRHRVGYMSQAFSLYNELTVSQNLWLHARLFHLPRDERGPRVADLVERFGLGDVSDELAAQLPLGVRQRLSLAVAIIHQPEILILDEPTSGVDPIARDRFWEILVELSRRQRVTIFLSTHFVNEGERCDRVSLMHAGRVLACDTPASLVEARGVESFEDAFVGFLEQAAGGDGGARHGGGTSTSHGSPAAGTDEGERRASGRPLGDERGPGEAPAQEVAASTDRSLRLSRLAAYARREALEIARDPVRLTFAFLGTLLLMVVFGFGITMDVDEMPFAVFDQDQSPASGDYVDALRGSRYFKARPAAGGRAELIRRLRANEISVAVEIPPEFGRQLRRGERPRVSVWIDGADPSRASTVASYVEGFHRWFTRSWRTAEGLEEPGLETVELETRFRYNPTFESIYVIVPSVPAILLVLIPAILMAVSVVKEKELGSITNFYVTPSKRLEFLLGKQLPYVAVGMLAFAMLTVVSVAVFDVQFKGSLWMLTCCALAYVVTTTGIGLLISSFTSSQVAAVFVTTVVTILPTIQFSGLLQPVSTLEGPGRWIGALWPTTYYMHASVGAFTKGLSAAEMAGDLAALLAFIPVLTLLATLTLPIQER